jgi:hypothetical protein
MFGVPVPAKPEVLADDFLGEDLRRHRRDLQLVAVASLVVVALDLVPEKISALGVDFKETEQSRLLWTLFALTLAFLALFLFHAWSALSRWCDAFHAGEAEQRVFQDQIPDRQAWIRARLDEAHGADPSRLDTLAAEIDGQIVKLSGVRLRARTGQMLSTLGKLRFAVDFLVPTALGIAAAIVLLVRAI